MIVSVLLRAFFRFGAMGVMVVIAVDLDIERPQFVVVGESPGKGKDVADMEFLAVQRRGIIPYGDDFRRGHVLFLGFAAAYQKKGESGEGRSRNDYVRFHDVQSLKLESQHERGVDAGLRDTDEPIITCMVVIAPVQKVIHLQTGLEESLPEAERGTEGGVKTIEGWDRLP